MRRTIEELVVPVRVDVDSRPDIAERYGLGGWPSVLVLTPNGHVLTGGQHLEAGPLVDVLRRIAERLTRAALDPDAAALPGAVRPKEMADVDTDALLVRFLDAAESELRDAFGRGRRWIGHAPALGFLLSLWERRQLGRAADLAARWLDLTLAAGLQDGEGAVLRPAADLRAHGPEPVALLEQNAAFLEVLASAAVVLQRADFQTRAADLATFMRTRLGHPAGGFVHAWGRVRDITPDDERDGPPPGRVLDARRFVGTNALSVRAWIQAQSVLPATTVSEVVSRTLETVLTPAFSSGSGVVACLDEQESVRLLAPQLQAADGYLAVFDATGQPVYLDAAHEVLLAALRDFRDPESELLRDRVSSSTDETARLAEPMTSTVENTLAVRLLTRIGVSRTQPELLDHARALLERSRVILAEAPPDWAHHLAAWQELMTADS